MNKSLFLLLVLLLTGCASFQVSTLNHDPIYAIEGSDAEITVIDNEFELQRLLRTDFNFRYDFAQYAISQPRSFDWNNRVLGNRYSFYNPYYSRSQMWNDWVWGYNWNSPHRWSPFGYDRWGYNNYGYGIGWSYSWNNRRWAKLKQNDWIVVWRHRNRTTQKYNIYKVSFKGKQLIQRMYRIMLNEEDIPTSMRRNKLIKGSSYTDKVMTQAIYNVNKDKTR